MTFKELQQSLPHGFHDAKLHLLSINYQSKKIVMEVDFWIGDMGSSSANLREAYKAASVEIRNFSFISIEPPDGTYPYEQTRILKIDADEPNAEQSSNYSNHAPGRFRFWIYCAELNSFMRVVGESMVLTWKNSSGSFKLKATKFIARGFAVTNLAFMLANIISRFSGRMAASSFDFGSFGGTALFLAGSLYLLYFPHRVQWFGSKLDGGDDINITVGYIFSSMFGVGALLFNFAAVLTA